MTTTKTLENSNTGKKKKEKKRKRKKKERKKRREKRKTNKTNPKINVFLHLWKRSVLIDNNKVFDCSSATS